MAVSVRSVSAVFTALGFMGISNAAYSADILEIRGITLTAYQGGGTTVQGIQPLADQRAVNIDGSLRASVPFGWAVAGNPFAEPWGGQLRWGDMRADLGAYSPTDIDLALPSQGSGRWVVGRTFNSRQSAASNGYQGRNWMQTSQPELVYASPGITAADDTIYIVFGADRYAEFQRLDATSDYFKGKNGAAGMIKKTAGSPDIFVYHLPDGVRVWFFGGNTSSNRANWQIWKIADAAGNTAYVGDSSTAATAVTSGYDASSRLTTAYDAAGRRYTYTYSTHDSIYRLDQVLAEIDAGGGWGSPGTETMVGRVDYTYYETGSTTPPTASRVPSPPPTPTPTALSTAPTSP